MRILASVFLLALVFTPSAPNWPYVYSGVVYHDYNRNGVRDANEPGVAGAVVQILDKTLVLQDEVTTDASGLYSLTIDIGTGGCGNSYVVIREVDAWGYISTSVNDVFVSVCDSRYFVNHFGDVAASPDLLPCKEYVPMVRQ